MGDNSPITLEVIAAQMAFLREDVSNMSQKLDSFHADKVSYREWNQRNGSVDQRFDVYGREIGDLRADIGNVRTELRSKSVPWPSVASVVIAIAALAWTIFRPL